MIVGLLVHTNGNGMYLCNVCLRCREVCGFMRHYSPMRIVDGLRIVPIETVAYNGKSLFMFLNVNDLSEKHAYYRLKS